MRVDFGLVNMGWVNRYDLLVLIHNVQRLICTHCYTVWGFYDNNGEM